MAGEYHIALYRFEESGDGDTVSIGPVYWGGNAGQLGHKDFVAAAASALQWIRPGQPHRWARIELFQVGGEAIILKSLPKGKDYTREELETYD